MNKHPFNGVFGVYGSCKICKIGQSCFLNGVQDKEVDQFEQIVERKLVLKKDAHLFERDKPFASIYVVQNGCLKSYRNSNTESEQITAFYFPGDLIGLNAIQDQKHPDSVAAIETATLCELPFDEVNRLCQKSPQLQRNLYQLFSHEVNKVQQSRACLRQKTADSRYAGFLLWLSERYQTFDSSATQQILLQMPRSDIADYLNLTPETICRVSSRLQQEGLIKVKDNWVELVHYDVLKQLAESNIVRPKTIMQPEINRSITQECTNY